MRMNRFDAYLSRLCEVLGHADREVPMREYCTGLMLPLKRKSVEPIAAHVGPEAVSAKHQSLLHFVGISAWSDEAMLASVHDYVIERVPEEGRKDFVLVVDDTGHPKQGRDSVSVARRRKAAHVPPEVGFATKPQIALGQLAWVCEQDMAGGVQAVLADSA